MSDSGEKRVNNQQTLFLDTENAPNFAAVWNIHEQHVRYSDLIKEWFFLSGQWSWNDSKKINTVSLLDDPKRFKRDHTDDRHVVKTIHGVLEEADIVVGHNIKGHDLKKLQAKFIEHKLKPVRMPEIVDTLEWARKFGFTSRKLGDLCKKLGLTEKLSHEPGLFLKAAAGDRKAIQDIVDYGRGDIPTARELYYRLRPYAHKHPNANLWRADGIKCCPKCQSDNIEARGFSVSASGKFQRYQCQECGGWFKSGKSVKRVEMR